MARPFVRLKDEGCFSIRRGEVKRLSSFPLRRCVTSFAGSSAGSALGRRLDGDQKNEAEQSRTRSDRCDATGTAILANSPHSSSREGRSFHRRVKSYGVILVTLALRSCFISVFGRPRPGFGLAGARSGRSRVAEGQRAATCP